MPAQLNRYITIDPQILSGTPVISGTRIPVERVSYLVRTGYTPKDLKQEFPQVEARKISYLISYLMEAGLNVFKTEKKISPSI